MERKLFEVCKWRLDGMYLNTYVHKEKSKLTQIRHEFSLMFFKNHRFEDSNFFPSFVKRDNKTHLSDLIIEN